MMDKMTFKGTIGAPCKPLSQMKEDGSFKGNMMDAMKKMMGDDMESMMKGEMGMKAGDKMKDGAEGMKEMMMAGKGGMKEMMGDGMDEMNDMMKEMMDGKDDDEGMNKMRIKMAGELRGMLKSNPSDMDKVKEGMGEKMEGMMKEGMMEMQKKEKGDMLDMMGGQMGMMVLMGMGAGIDAAGDSLSTKFSEMATKMKAEMDAEKPDPKKILEEGGEAMMKYNDGCDEAGELCCGQTE